MNIKRQIIVTITCLSFAVGDRGFAAEDSDPLLDFIQSYLLGKAADAVLDSVTGKPDVNELQRRIQRLERLLGDSAGPISGLRSQVTSSTTSSQFRDQASTAMEALRTAVARNPEALSHIYVGSVGRLKAVFALTWDSNGGVSGVYCNPTRDATRIYDLTGSNPSEGVLELKEFTDSNLSARITLSKQTNPAWIVWSGKMHNTDGRVLDVTFQRERK